MVSIIFIAVLGTAVAFLAVFVIRAILVPQHIEGVQKLLKQNKIQAAIKLGKSLTNKNPHDVEAHYFLGKAFLADKKDELTLAEFKFVNQHAIFEQTIIVESEFRAEMAKLYLKFNQPEEALKEYILLIKMMPREAENYFQAGKLMESRQKTDQAFSFYQQAVHLDPQHYKAHVAIGKFFFRAKQNAEALREFNTAIAIKPDDFSLYYHLGRIYKETKEYATAISTFEKALRDPEFKQRAYIERGSCFIAAQNIDRAIEEFDNAVKSSRNERSNETVFARYCLADCYEKNRKISQALVQWNAITQVSSGYKNVMEKLTEYQDLQSNDSMKEYLTSSPEDFSSIAQSIVKKIFGLSPKGVEKTKYGCKVTATEANKNVRQSLSIFYFFREPDPIDENVVRELEEEIKEQKAKKGVAYSSTGFTRQASTFSEGRLLELCDRAKLSAALAKAGV